jgi:hypothetical protein
MFLVGPKVLERKEKKKNKNNNNKKRSKTTLFGRLNYLILRSKIKVPRRSLRYATHHIMVMHPHTNCYIMFLLAIMLSPDIL